MGDGDSELHAPVSPPAHCVFDVRPVPRADAAADAGPVASAHLPPAASSVFQQGATTPVEASPCHDARVAECPGGDMDSVLGGSQLNGDLSFEESDPSVSAVHPDSPPLPSWKELAYLIVDSAPSAVLTAVIILIDAVCFLTALIYLQTQTAFEALEYGYRFIDWITAVFFSMEVVVRLFSYGILFYIHSIVRCLDLGVSLANFAVVLAMSIFTVPRWLLVVRYVRLFRIVTASIIWRERRLKRKARKELQDLVLLLDAERSSQGRLTKWRIESSAIAMGEPAGHGGFGTVYQGLFRGTLVAVKQIFQNVNAENSASIEDEAITLVNLRHPNVVLFMGFVHEPGKLWIVTEYCSRGSLRDFLDDETMTLTQSRILKFALGTARGLAYLHGQDPPVLHLDLKTSNVLISSGWDAKLADFGLSRSVDKVEKGAFAGTMQYAAPEILEANAFSTAADIYSFGICLWEIAAREIPFHGLSPMDVLFGVVKDSLRPSVEVISSPVGYETQMWSSVDVHGEVELSANIVNAPNRAGKERARDSTLPAIDLPKSQSFRGLGKFMSADGIGSKAVDRSTDSKHQRYRSNSSAGGAKDTSILSDIVTAGTRAPGSSQTCQRRDRPDEIRSNDVVNSIVGGSVSRNGINGLNVISRRVSATIQLFDDRPPAARRVGTQRQSSDTNGGLFGAFQSNAGHMGGSGAPMHFQATLLQTLRSKLPSLPLNGAVRSKETSTGHTFHARHERIDGGLLLERSVTAGDNSCSQKELLETEAIVLNSSKAQACVGDDASVNSIFARRVKSLSLASPECENDYYRQTKVQMTAEDPNIDKQNSRSGKHSKGYAAGSAHGPVAMPKEYVELIQGCWSQNPASRPNTDEIVWRLVGLIDSQLRRK